MSPTKNWDGIVHDRTIDFEDVKNRHPKTLSTSQIDDFNRDGFISGLPVFSQEECNENRAYFDLLLSEVESFNDGRDVYSIMGYHNRCQGIWDLANHPKILDYVEDLIGPDIVCWTSHYFCKQPHDPRPVNWHQDATYWPVRPARTVTVWLAIDDVTDQNSPMQFIEGSHKLGKLEWQEAPENAVLRQSVPNADFYGSVFSNTLRAGEISLHTSTLLHGSQPNSSPKRRCGLTLRYIPPTCGVLPKAESLFRNVIVCRGNGGPWLASRRPDGDDLRPFVRS